LQETGSDPAPVVRKVVIPIIDRKECADDYADVYPITDGMICAGLKEGGKDSCSGENFRRNMLLLQKQNKTRFHEDCILILGDSGGPLVVNGALAGVVSWGEGCAEKGFPGVYTNVKKFAPWVQDQIAKLK